MEMSERIRFYGTSAGGRKAGRTSKERYGPDFFIRIGGLGGEKSRGGGFSKDPELARTAGAKGGKKSRGGGRKKRDE